MNFYLVEGEDQTSKKLDSIYRGKSDCYQDIEDPNKTITELSINSRTLYENLGDLCHHDLYHSAAKGSRNKRSHDEQPTLSPITDLFRRCVLCWFLILFVIGDFLFCLWFLFGMGWGKRLRIWVGGFFFPAVDCWWWWWMFVLC